MTDLFLHNLDALPASSTVCIVGKKGRCSRLRKLLETLRPDLRIIRLIDTDCVDLIHSPELSRTSRAGRQMRSADFILIAQTKFRQTVALLQQEGMPPCRVVNPNFYHPFIQFPSSSERLAGRLEEAKQILHRDEDRAIYDVILKSLSPRGDWTGVYHTLLEICGEPERQYLDFVDASSIRTVLEGGIGDGLTTIRMFRRFRRPIIHGLDPDTENYRQSYLREYIEASRSIHIHPIGLWSSPCRLPFQFSDPGRSSVPGVDRNPGSSDRVEATSIDAFVRGAGITKLDFIKLDLEGADFEAIKGAAETIHSHRPQIAVCMYHRLEHYYEIPLFIASHAADYLFRVGHYSPIHVFSETVLYAIPKEKVKSAS